MDLSSKYRAMILWLFPPGLAFARSVGTVLYNLCHALAQEPARLHERALAIIEEADPTTTKELLSDWERVLALPEVGVSTGGTFQQRRNDVVSKWTMRGGQAKQKFIERAQKQGFTITIDEFRPFRTGMSRCGDRLYSRTWRHAFRVNAPSVTLSVFRAGSSRCGERLRNWGDEARLEAAIRKKAASHLIPIFSYA
jgi:uncharacterized protein YmfQ (DUF2313 family)